MGAAPLHARLDRSEYSDVYGLEMCGAKRFIHQRIMLVRLEADMAASEMKEESFQ